MMQRNIDKLFQSKLSDFELPKEGNWPLVKHLLKEQQVQMKIIRRNKHIFYALTSLVFVGVIVLFVWNNEHTVEKITMPEKTTEGNSILQKTTTSPDKTATEGNSILQTTTTSPDKTIEKEGFTNLSSDKLNNEPSFIKVNTDNKNIKPSESSTYLESNAYTSYVYLPKDTVETTIVNLGKEFNSSFDDYAPVINADASFMYFTSRRPVTEKEIKSSTPSTENIYFSSFNAESQKWTSPQLLPSQINKSNRFNSAISLSKDGHCMFIYRDDKSGNGDIYKSYLHEKSWSDPIKLPEPINSKYIETSASISPDGNTIYFTSNREGGQGGLDIWYCSKNPEGSWGQAINMGPTINSPFNEEGVFIHSDGKTLYFSSRGHKGFGGYDIFYSKFDSNKWTVPENLGKTINTPDDDVYFVMDANGKVGYYSSIKNEGLGEKDIYRINFSTAESDNNKTLLTLFKGVVIDKENSQALEAEIKIIDIETDKTISTMKSDSLSGEFLVSLPKGKNYGISVSKEDYLFYYDSINIPDTASYNKIIKTILLPKLTEDSKIILNNIFYEYNKYNLTEKSISELNSIYDLMIKNPTLKLEISAHTDSRGSDYLNNKLSQQRAQVCVDYLTQKGINKDRLIAKGYGKQQLLISDAEIDNLKSYAEKMVAHQYNRRTEFRIIEK